MIPLVEGIANRVRLKVEASVDIRGFSAVLAASGILKSIPNLTDDSIFVDFTAGEVAGINAAPEWTYGKLEVYDAEGNFYIAYLPSFCRIPADEAVLAQGNQVLYLTIVSTKGVTYSGGGGDPSEYATKEDLAEVERQVGNVRHAVDHAEKTHITSHVVDEDGDGQPDDETMYFHPEKTE